jgi:carotenoid cleavage dioxygenase-like enzyme
MTVSFASDPLSVGYFAPTRFEADVYDCELIEGAIPKELDGTFYRVGMDWFYPSKFKDDSPFNADGYVSMFRFANGSVDYKGRYVKTQRYLADAQARRQLFGYYRNVNTDDPAARGVSRNVANTNLVAHAGKLFALKEDSPPMMIDPDTLATLGEWNFAGAYSTPTFTAHPKVDTRTGEMICFGYEADGDASNAIVFYFVNRDGKVTRNVRFKAPYVSMVHDIAVSEKHIVIPVYGMTTSPERLRSGKIHWGWDASLPSWYGVLPRDGEAKDVRWFEGPERACVHTFNATTHGNKVVMEAPISDSNPFPFFPSVDATPFDRARSRTVTRRVTLDLGSRSGKWQEETLFDHAPGALSRIDDRYITQPYRFGFMGYTDSTRPFDAARGGNNMAGRLTNCYGRFDMSSGKLSSYFVGDVQSLQECSFAPRAATASEGDGFLVGVAANYAERNSELVVVDAVSMQGLARIRMPFRLSSQIHGVYVPSGTLPSSSKA